jgi:hypothetical protein
MPIDLRKPNPFYDDRTIDTLSTYPLLLYPTGGYQQSIGTSANYVSVGDKWHIAISPYLMCANGYTHRKGRPVHRHAKVSTCYEIGQQADYNY